MLASCLAFASVQSRKLGDMSGDMAKKTTITIESASVVVMHGQSLPRAWCSICAAESEVIALDSIGVVSNLKPEVIEAWLSSGQLHHARSTDGSDVICLNSLLATVQTKNLADREKNAAAATQRRRAK